MENPALKLHVLLNEAYRLSRPNPLGSPNGFKDTWSRVFDINKDDTSTLLNSVASLVNLWVSTKEYIKNNEMLNDETNIKFIDKVGAALTQIDFQGDMSHFIKHIDKETLTALGYIAKQINFVYKFNQQTINIDEINNLINEIDSLIDSIRHSSLPEDIQSMLLKNLNLIRYSLSNYKISGVDGVRTALEQTIGSLYLSGIVKSPLAEKEEVKGTFSFLSTLCTILSTGAAFKELIEPIITNLLPK